MLSIFKGQSEFLMDCKLETYVHDKKGLKSYLIHG